MSYFRVRPAEDEEFTQLEALYAAFLDETLASPLLARNPEADPVLALEQLMRREPSTMLVAEAGGTLAGFAFVEVRRGTGARRGWAGRLFDALTLRRRGQPVLLPARGWLGHLYVAPAHRRKGVAESLVRAAADWTRKQDAAVLDLNVLASNEPARRLYAKLGMTEMLVEYRLSL